MTQIFTANIPTPNEELAIGMQTVVQINGKFIRDEKLIAELPKGSCHGKHFKTESGHSVCYLNGGSTIVEVQFDADSLPPDELIWWL